MVTTITSPSPAAAQVVPELQINSEQYIVIDAETGEVFAQRGAHERNAMASLTKVFTAIEAIESAPPDYLITIDESDMPVPGASYMGFQPGEVFTLEDLLHGLMLPSGNDAAHAIARSLGYQEGDTPEEAVARFVERMNQRVRDMGLENTHLVNPDGWGVPGHYTTVADLAAFMRYALQYPRFVKLISTAQYTTTTGQELHNNNRMMGWYDDLIGGKTGYDDDAGWCLIEVAERNGHTMISVTFDGIHENQDWYDDNQVLLEYGFEQKLKRVADGRDIASDVISFLDPDAAVISRTASSGASLGGAHLAGGGDPLSQGSDPANHAADPLSHVAQGFVDGDRGPAAGSAAGTILAVVGLILLARAMGAYAQPGRPREATGPAFGGRPRRRRRIATAARRAD